MEARSDQIHELKKISVIAVSIGELRFEVRSMFRGLNRRLDEFLRHRGNESTGTWEQQIEDLDLVATKLYLSVDDPDLEMQHSFDFKSVQIMDSKGTKNLDPPDSVVFRMGLIEVDSLSLSSDDLFAALHLPPWPSSRPPSWLMHRIHRYCHVHADNMSRSVYCRSDVVDLCLPIPCSISDLQSSHFSFMVGRASSIWYGCVMRGDVNSISVGSGTNIQDNSLEHVAKSNISRKVLPTIIGDNVTIDHNVVMHGCTVKNESFMGIGAVLLDGVVVEKKAMVAGGALVRQNTRIPSGEVWGGNPAKFMRKLTKEEIAFISQSASNYCNLAKVHAAENAKAFDEIEFEKVLGIHWLLFSVTVSTACFVQSKLSFPLLMVIFDIGPLYYINSRGIVGVHLLDVQQLNLLLDGTSAQGVNRHFLALFAGHMSMLGKVVFSLVMLLHFWTVVTIWMNGLCCDLGARFI
ncbi:hypothetical protein Syun_020756 [Stephania yunnanensis]|uniref:Uncharacterized protein n=1 Tax=Stephania yunnanensis TaxID=152371 RepID=A0AAP0IEE6_9MAGN